MNTVEKLMSEHRHIEDVLACLGAAADAALKSGNPDTDSFVKCIEFFRAYADRSHHHKEEDLLFPAMERSGIPRETGPIGVMLNEHEIGRSLLGRLEHHLGHRTGNWIEDLRRDAHEYITLLQHHIQKEDHILFPMATDVLSEKEKAEMDRKCDEFESRDENAAANAKHLLVAQQLCRKWGVNATT